MKKIDLGQGLTLLANLGVIAGIVFLAVEIQQANRIALVSAEYELRNNFSAINELLLTDSELAEFLHQAEILGSQLDGISADRARMWTYRLINVWIAAEFAYQNGIATEATHQNILENVRARLERARNSREMIAIWRASYNTFPSLASTDVFALMDQMLGEYERAGSAD